MCLLLSSFLTFLGKNANTDKLRLICDKSISYMWCTQIIDRLFFNHLINFLWVSLLACFLYYTRRKKLFFFSTFLLNLVKHVWYKLCGRWVCLTRIERKRYLKIKVIRFLSKCDLFSPSMETALSLIWQHDSN